MLLKRSLESIDGRRFLAKTLARRSLVRLRGPPARAGAPVHSGETGRTRPFLFSFGAIDGDAWPVAAFDRARSSFWFTCALGRCGAAEPPCDEAVC